MVIIRLVPESLEGDSVSHWELRLKCVPIEHRLFFCLLDLRLRKVNALGVRQQHDHLPRKVALTLGITYTARVLVREAGRQVNVDKLVVNAIEGVIDT